MPLVEKGVRGMTAGLAPLEHTETRSANSAPQQVTESMRAVTSL